MTLPVRYTNPNIKRVPKTARAKTTTAEGISTKRTVSPTVEKINIDKSTWIFGCIEDSQTKSLICRYVNNND
jgi:hypothetical protein